MKIENRRKAYAIGFLGSGFALAATGLFIVWSPDDWSSVFNITLTLLVTLLSSAILFTLSFSQDDRVSKKTVVIIGGCAIALAATLIAEIWFDIFEDSMLFQVVVTLLVIAGAAGFFLSVWDDFFENKKLKDENYLD